MATDVAPTASITGRLSPPWVAGRPGPARLVAVIAGQGIRSYARSPIALFFTVGFPVGFLAIVAALYGNAVIDSLGGIHVVQYFAPALAVFGAAQASFCILATATAQLREQGVLKRLRGTPAPPAAIIAGRILASVVVAVAAVVVMLVVAVSAYHMRIVWRTVPAVVVTLVVGIGSFAALGLAVVALTRRSTAVTAITNGVLIPLSFISNVFMLSTSMPRPLQWLGSALPLKPFAVAMEHGFNPTVSGNGFDPGRLLLVAGWGLAGALVAMRYFRWEPVGGAGPAAAADLPAQRAERTAVRPTDVRPLSVAAPGRPGVVRTLAGQAGHAVTSTLREPGSVFFAVVMPVLLLVLFPVLVGGDEANRVGTVHGLLPAMAAYGSAVAGYVNVASSVAEARESGVLKRLRATPVQPWAYLLGWVAAAELMSALALALLVAVAGFGYGVWPDPAQLPATLVTLVVCAACFTVMGFLVLRLVRSAQALTATALGTLLPLSFVSDVFVIGARMPAPLEFIGNAFPLKHAVHAFDHAFRSGLAPAGFAWLDLAVVAAWTVVGVVVARRMPWQPRGQ